MSAINYVFIGFSNEFGAFESGATAALVGPTLSVVGGGFATLLVVAIVRAAWPQLFRIGPLHTLAPRDRPSPVASATMDLSTIASAKVDLGRLDHDNWCKVWVFSLLLCRLLSPFRWYLCRPTHEPIW